MDDLSTIFYIIIAIIYVIYSAIKRGKPTGLPQGNPQQQGQDEYEDATQDSPAPTTQRRPSFEDLLREFTRQEPEPETVEEQFEEPRDYYNPEEPVKQEKKKTSAYDQFQNVEVIGEDILSGPSVFKAPDREDEVSGSKLGSEIREMLKDPEGFKKAILINEILRPKYF